jgi:hypothetical protein
MELGDLPRTNKHPPVELRRDGHFVLFYVTRELVRFFLPVLLGRHLYALELERVCIDPFPEALDLINREPIVSDEQVAHGDVQVTLTLTTRRLGSLIVDSVGK